MYVHNTYAFIFMSMGIRYGGYAILERDASMECAGTANAGGFMSVSTICFLQYVVQISRNIKFYTITQGFSFIM